MAFFALAAPSSEAAGDTYALSAITEDMLTEVNGVKTLEITSAKDVYITADGDLCDFAVSVKAPNTFIQGSDTESTVLGIYVEGNLSVTGGKIMARAESGSAMTVIGGSAKFSSCYVTAKSLSANGLILENSTLTFGDGGYLIATGKSTGVIADSSAIEVASGGVFKAYSVDSCAVRVTGDGKFEVTSGKIFLGGKNRAIAGGITVPQSAICIGDAQTEPSAFIVTKDQKINITLDPGHGGKDPGATHAAEKYAQGSASYNFYLEKNLTLKTAQYIKKYLEQSDRFSVMMTRNDDTKLTLAERCEIALAQDADILLSVHYNYDNIKSLNGACAYVCQFDRYVLDDFAKTLVSGLGRLGISDFGVFTRLDTEYDGDPAVWWNLYDNEKSEDVNTGTYCDYYGVINRSASYYIYPTILEHLYLSNSDDFAKIPNEAALEAIGKQDAESIISYFKVSASVSDENLPDYLKSLYTSALNAGDGSYTASSFEDGLYAYCSGADKYVGSSAKKDAARSIFLK